MVGDRVEVVEGVVDDGEETVDGVLVILDGKFSVAIDKMDRIKSILSSRMSLALWSWSQSAALSDALWPRTLPYAATMATCCSLRWYV